MTPLPVFRHMSEADLSAVLALEADSFVSADRWTVSMIREELTRPDRIYIGAYAPTSFASPAELQANERSNQPSVLEPAAHEPSETPTNIAPQTYESFTSSANVAPKNYGATEGLAARKDGLSAAGETLVGMAGVRVGIDAELMTIGVSPAFQGKGLGTALLTRLIENLQTVRIEPGGRFSIVEDDWQPAMLNGQINSAGRRVERLILEVRSSNQPAIALYERLGFTKLGVIANYYHRPTEDALVMAKQLSNFNG